MNLLLCGFNVDAKVEDGSSPLSAAALSGSVELAQVLLDHGAMINIQDKEGDTPLNNAIYSRRRHVVDFLLRRNADPTIRSESGQTALGYASLPGSHGAPVDDKIVQALETALAENVSTSVNTDDHEGQPRIRAAHSFSENAIAPERWQVMAEAPMARAAAALVSEPVGRLSRGDLVSVVARRVIDLGNGTEILRLHFVDGPAERCPEGWITPWMPNSQTILLQRVDPGEEWESQQPEGEENS